MEFWEWCRELRHAYRSSGVERNAVKDTSEHENSYSTTDSNSTGSRGRESVYPQRIGQGSKRSVSCFLIGTKEENKGSSSPTSKEDVSTKTTVACGTESNKVQLNSEGDCMITTAMSGPSPFDIADEGSFPMTHTYEEPVEENKGEDFLVEDVIIPQDHQVMEKKSSLYGKSKTFPTSRHDQMHASRNCCVDQVCPPHGAKSVMGRRAKMEDTFVAIPDLIGVAFADSLNEIIPPRIANQIQQNSGQSLAASDHEEEGMSHGESLPMPKKSHRLCCGDAKGKKEGTMIEQIHFFGVFDGHGGADAAHHCKETMHERLKEAILSTCFEKGDVKDLDPNMLCSSKAFSKALAEAFRVTDEDFAKIGGDSEELSLVGTTAVVALLSSQSMYLANAGDSRAVLFRDGKALALTDDHKAAREDETARVEAAGGQILFWNGVRVMGLLAVSRAIGDHSLRPYVIADPEVTVVNRHASDELMVMASDGLWDVISNEEACSLAKKCLLRARQKGSSRENAARVAATVLTRAAVDRGSRDNVTVLVIDLMQDPDEFLHADAMKMRLSEEIVVGRNICSSDEGSEPVKSGESSPRTEPLQNDLLPVEDTCNDSESEQDEDEPEMTPYYSFKSPFEMVEPPPNMTE